MDRIENNNAPGFFARLKQHHIYRVAAWYGASIAVLIQIVARAFPYFGWAAAVPAVIIILIAGFPVAIVLAWLLVKPADSSAQSLWQRRHWKLGAAITPVVIAAVVVSGIYAFHLSEQHAEYLAAEQPVTKTATIPAYVNTSAQPAMTAIPAKSIAVLPFENLSPDKNNAYFAAGMQDMILTKLADIGDLKVIARTSTEKYASHPDDLKTIAQQLGVATILEGSVQKSGNQVLINVQLIDVNTHAHLWANAYQRTLDNIFGVEGEVAQKVAQALDANLTAAERQHLGATPTRNPQAWVLYLQGDYYKNRGFPSFNVADFDAAIRNYHAATEQDPQFALAFARLAIAQMSRLYFGGDDGLHLADAARSAVARALTLAPYLPDAHLAQGYYADYAKRDYAAAMRAFQTALALKPGNSETIFMIGVIHEHRGEFDAAIESCSLALNLDPRNVIAAIGLTRSYIAERRYPEAIRAAQLGLAVAPDSNVLRAQLAGVVLDQTGSIDQSLAVLDAAPVSIQNTPSIIWKRAYLLYLRRDYTAALAVVNNFHAALPDTGLADSFRGDIQWHLGNRDKAREFYLRSNVKLETYLKQASRVGYAERGTLGWNYARLRRNREALKQGRLGIQAAPLEKDFIDGTSALLNMADIQALVGQTDEAFATLDRLMALPTGNILSVTDLGFNPDWDPFRQDPRFQALLKKYIQQKATSIQ